MVTAFAEGHGASICPSRRIWKRPRLNTSISGRAAGAHEGRIGSASIALRRGASGCRAPIRAGAGLSSVQRQATGGGAETRRSQVAASW